MKSYKGKGRWGRAKAYGLSAPLQPASPKLITLDRGSFLLNTFYPRQLARFLCRSKPWLYMSTPVIIFERTLQERGFWIAESEIIHATLWNAWRRSCYHSGKSSKEAQQISAMKYGTDSGKGIPHTRDESSVSWGLDRYSHRNISLAKRFASELKNSKIFPVRLLVKV